MWLFIRLALALSCGLWAAFAAGLLVLGVAILPPLLLLAAWAWWHSRRHAFRGTGWAYGTARLETTAELLAKGHLREEGGLLLGQVAAPPLAEAARLLFTAPLSESEAACRAFLAAGCRRGRRYSWLRLRGVTHAACFSPTGGGKTTGVVIPQLLTDPTPAVVTDFKNGEIARETAAYRARAFGHRIVLLDPWRLVTDHPDQLNALDFLNPSDPRSLDWLSALADDVVVRDETEIERHWNDSAHVFIWACAAWTLLKGRPGVRDLQTVAQLLASPAELHTATRMMMQSPAWGGMMARLGGQLGHYVERERGSALTTSCRHLKFMSTPCVAESTSRSTFDPHELRAGRRPMTAYLIGPAEFQHSHIGLTRYWLGTLVRACYAGGVSHRGRVRFILDEAASLGRTQSITDAVQTGRGYAMSLFFIYQSLGQLKKCFPEGQDQTFLSNMDAQIYFGPPNDWDTASRLSEMIGDATITVRQQSGGRSGTTNRDPHGLETTSTTWNEGYSCNEVGRRLLRPEEILNLPERAALVLSRTTNPILCWLVRHYEPAFRDAPGLVPSRRRRAAGQCLFLVAASALLAFLLGDMAVRRREAAPPPPPPPAWQQPQHPYTPRRR